MSLIERERPSPLPSSFPGAASWATRPDAPAAPTAWYRLADGVLAVAGAHPRFAATVEEIFGDCRVAEAEGAQLAAAGNPCVTCDVAAPDGGAVGVAVRGGATVDLHAFALALFGERGYVAGPADGDWATIVEAGAAAPPLLLVHGDRLIAREGAPWEGLVANIAISRLMQSQPGVLFFHGGTVAVAGRGVLVAGNKAQGKTTLAMTLALRGHALLGDEIAALRVATRELVPVRRALSVRDGPASAALAPRLAEATRQRLTYPDGEARTRVAVSALFPTPAPAAVPLGLLVLLAPFAPAPRLEVLPPGHAARRGASPLAATLWGAASAVRAMQLLRLLAGVPAIILHPGAPDETAALVETHLQSLS
jgi:hypothetical protein